MSLFESRYARLIESGGSWYAPEAQAEVARKWVETLSRETPGTVVELGCGTGENVRALAARGWDAYGIEIAPSAIASARSRGAGGFLVADLGEPLVTDFPPADVVLDGHCLHFQIGSRRAVFLANARRLLRPGGRFYVDTNVGEPRTPHLDYDPVARTSRTGDVVTNYWASPVEVLTELRRAGFSIEASESVPGDSDRLIVHARLPA